MSNTIYYFSATGNSLHAANRIAGQLDDCNVISMAPLLDKPEIIADSPVIGLVFPLHALGLPPLVASFAEKLNVSPGHYIFAVVTCGSPYFSGALHQLKSLLAGKGLSLAAGYHVKMISNYTPLSDIPAPKKKEQLLRQADEKLASIAKRVKRGEPYVESELWGSLSPFINRGWKKKACRIGQKVFLQ